ncbi:MAG: flavodoxin domain-containing protein [Burkholderiales bacterium]|nr:flavodoxin domain-containing protein [Burkholderiales bacterium]
MVTLDADHEPEVVSSAGNAPDRPAATLALLQGIAVRELVKLNFPAAADAEDTWQVGTTRGQGWIDRRSGATLAWRDASSAQRINDWAMLLHTGEGAWLWALALGLAGLSIPLFWVTGLRLWWQARRLRPRIRANSTLAQADTLIFVASENGSTWGFAQTLHTALVRAGHRVHTNALEHFAAGAVARQIFVLAATYGDGQAPAHAAPALERIAGTPAGAARVSVLGFGDRQFRAFCAYAEALADALDSQGWPTLLPLARIHQQSTQEFARWGEQLAQALGEPVVLDHRLPVPRTTTLQLVSRQDYPGAASRRQSCALPGPRQAGSIGWPGARCRASSRATCWACCRRAMRHHACIRSPRAGATASSRSACAGAPTACAPTTCTHCGRARRSRPSCGPTRRSRSSPRVGRSC